MITTTTPTATTTATTTETPPSSLGNRILTVTYGAISYAIAFGSILYAMGFLTGFAVPKSINSGADGGSTLAALGINLVLLSVFAVQHSLMARPAFKALWTRIVPGSIERPTYVLLSGLSLSLLFWQWQPMTDAIWTVDAGWLRSVIFGVYCVGWTVMLLATFMVDHFDLFGLRQVWAHFKGEGVPSNQFLVRGLYHVVRHPIQLGLLIAFWSTPDMTVGHLVFSIMMTAYIVVALQLEERDLLAEFGDEYREYSNQVFGLLPVKRFRGLAPTSRAA